jgi:Cu2+-exporting ATPase
MILVGENLDAIAQAVLLSRRMLRIARQNLSWAALYNFGSLPLAAVGLIPPWLAALGMSLSSMAVVLNAARLLPRRRMPGWTQ